MGQQKSFPSVASEMTFHKHNGVSKRGFSGIVDKRLSFDLYESDAVDGGYIAYNDAAQDAVVPQGESLYKEAEKC